eukprot:2945733-Prymnesium_polylepis.1
MRDGSGVEMNDSQRENLCRFSLETNQRSIHARKVKDAPEGTAKVKPYDVNAGGRTFANGEAMPAWE